MTGSAAVFWPRRAGHVLRVIEFHVEALFELFRERFQWWGNTADGRVADRAHGNVWGSELRQVTVHTILVTGKTWPHRIVRPMMAVCASH